MSLRRLLPLALAALVAVPAASQERADAASPAASEAAEARTRAIVSAADAFLASLTDAQREAATFAFGDAAQRANWSNFPDGAAARAGVRWGELDAGQRRALIALLGAVLSPRGLANALAQMAADDVVAATDDDGPDDSAPDADSDGGGPRGDRPPVNFGADYYYASLLGEPSETEPFTVQFGGHHLAINATVVGPRLALSPLLTGGEPLKFESDGTPIYLAGEEASLAHALVTDLSEAQRAEIVLSDERHALVLGPGEDGRTLPPEGLVASEMTTGQRALLLATIEARLGMMNADHLAPRLAEIEAGLDDTAFGWWDPLELGAGYFRITGPSLSIEYSPENDDGDATDRAHNVYRDPTNEYGAAWTAPD